LIVFTLQPLQCEELALVLLHGARGCQVFDQLRFMVGGLDFKDPAKPEDRYGKLTVE